MGSEDRESGRQEAPDSQDETSFGMNDDDFYVDEDTGAIFIGDTPISGRGKRPAREPQVQQAAAAQPQEEERIVLDEKGNLDIGEFRVHDNEVDNRDPIRDEFERGRKSPDELERERIASLEAEQQKQQTKQEEPQPQKKEWTLRVADQDRVINDETELLKLAQKGLGADYRFQELAEMRKQVEPFYQIALKMKEDPGFVEHVKSYGQPNYQVEGPEPFNVSQEDFERLVGERVSNQMSIRRLEWTHDSKYREFKGYPTAEEVRQKLLADSLHWDRFTRDWVDKNPVAYADKFQQTAQSLIRERQLDPDPARPIPKHVIEKQKTVLEKLKAKEAAKEKARVESAKTQAELSAADGRLALNRARKRAQETGDIADWAEVIAMMEFE